MVKIIVTIRRKLLYKYDKSSTGVPGIGFSDDEDKIDNRLE